MIGSEALTSTPSFLLKDCDMKPIMMHAHSCNLHLLIIQNSFQNPNLSVSHPFSDALDFNISGLYLPHRQKFLYPG